MSETPKKFVAYIIQNELSCADYLICVLVINREIAGCSIVRGHKKLHPFLPDGIEGGRNCVSSEDDSVHDVYNTIRVT